MKKTIFFSLLILMSIGADAQKGKRIYLNKGADGGCMIVPGSTPYQPGDTLVLRASLNPWTYVYIGGVSGQPRKPLVLTNEGEVELTTGLSVENAEYVHIAGHSP
jgi:hypothetical protein